jgi:hypothetical protein
LAGLLLVPWWSAPAAAQWQTSHPTALAQAVTATYTPRTRPPTRRRAPARHHGHATSPPRLRPSLTFTLASTGTPTARPAIDPTLGGAGISPLLTPETPVPSAVPELELDEDIVNVLLMGATTSQNTSSGYRTDVIIIARSTSAAARLLPRSPRPIRVDSG